MSAQPQASRLAYKRIHVVSPRSVTCLLLASIITTAFLPTFLAFDPSYLRLAGASTKLPLQSKRQQQQLLQHQVASTSYDSSSLQRLNEEPKSYARISSPSRDPFFQSISTDSATASAPWSKQRPVSSSLALVSAACSTVTSNAVQALSQIYLFSASLTANTVSAARSVLSIPTRAIPLLWSKAWWATPLTLCAVPVICQLLWKTNPSTPSWWKLVDVLGLLHGTGSSGNMNVAQIIGGFLLSNLAFFVAGIYLLQQFPFWNGVSTDRQPAIAIKSSDVAAQTSASGGRLSMIIPSTTNRLQQGPVWLQNFSSALRPTSWLGVWVLLAGAVSTLFHAVQTLGEYTVAEGWCFLDHGVAISGILYFAHVLGWPKTKQTWSLALLGVMTLAVPPAWVLALLSSVNAGAASSRVAAGLVYTTLHSVWHILSAATAVFWALDAKDKMLSKQPALSLL